MAVSSKPWAFNSRPAKLYCKARGHICKLRTHDKNHSNLGGEYATYCYLATCSPRTSPQ